MVRAVRSSLTISLLVCMLAQAAFGTSLIMERDSEYVARVGAVSRRFVVVEAISPRLRRHFRSGFAAERVASVLRKNGIRFRIKDRPTAGWNPSDAIRPKIVVVVLHDSSTEKLTLSLNLISYEQRSGSRFTPSLSAKKELSVEGALGADTQRVVARFFKAASTELLEAITKEYQRGTIRPRVPHSRRWHVEQRLLDRDPYRGRVYLALLAGTPAVLNAKLGYWGSLDFPVGFSIVGGFTSTAYRGVEATLDWMLDNEGEWRQAIGLSGGYLGTSSTNETQEKDSLGRVIKVTRTTVQQLELMVGPTYQLHWKSFSLSLGCRFSLESRQLVPHGQVGWRLPL